MALRASPDGARPRSDRALHLGSRRLRELGPGLLQDPLARTLLGLTFATGIVDAASFLVLGEVFAAMMTGNVLFLGFGVAGSAGSSVAEPGLAVICFLCGGLIGGLVAASATRRDSSYLGIGIGIEVALVGAATAVAAAATVRSEEAAGLAVIALLALAMGARNTIVRRIGVAELSTTVLTVAVSSLGAGTTFAGASPEHLVPRAAAVIAMLAGAVAGALLVKTSLAVALGAATVVSLLAAAALVAGSSRARATA